MAAARPAAAGGAPAGDGPSAGTGATARSRARRRAVEILFEAHARGVPPRQVLAERGADPHSPLPAYTPSLVEGVQAHAERIDEILDTYAKGWPVARMPAVDHAILQVAVFELLWGADTPDGVVLAEAVALADELSTESSAGFVNGLLGAIARLKPSLAR